MVKLSEQENILKLKALQTIETALVILLFAQRKTNNQRFEYVNPHSFMWRKSL